MVLSQFHKFVVLALVVKVSYGTPRIPDTDPIFHDVFPQYFSFGVSTGAYHHEGAWNDDGKGLSIWDYWVHNNPYAVVDGSNGDIASDAYHHIEEDVKILDHLNVRHYKFSLSWSRILPNGTGDINREGIKHYQKLLKLLNKKHIEPIVCLYNSDLPQALEDQGGFLNDNFPLWFLEYANVAFDNFGPNVKYWLTFSSPTEICSLGYGEGSIAPGVSNGPGVNDYICGHNLLKAHAEAYHLYDEVYRSSQDGKIAIDINSVWFEPASESQCDIDAAERRQQFQIGWFAHPIYVGDYPPLMIETIGQLSESQGFYDSRLPRFTRKEIQWIKDTHDFFALSYFKTMLVTDNEDQYYLSSPSYYSDTKADAVFYLGDDTWGIKKVILWVQKQYSNPSIFIVNNGYVSDDCTTEDYDRIEYIKKILIHIRSAMVNYGARVYGYTHYSIYDGFEWTLGYTVKLGLYAIDFNSPMRTRTPRISADYYQNLCRYGCIDYPCPPRYTV
ncbi:unnamed protein product [Phyllotreta striolata]|uniref:Glycoside hydrolase family 1 n=1 Tax=Phyllotreta striolata TaxID=444603 RepID=A0A9N9TEM2_PHYSR|nr:unnamed protein product [Phyllotreta striolata]